MTWLCEMVPRWIQFSGCTRIKEAGREMHTLLEMIDSLGAILWAWVTRAPHEDEEDDGARPVADTNDATDV
jgi:hypothetical protein